MEGQAAASVIATEDLQVAGELQRILRRGLLRLYTNHDVIGCELGGALKNVVARPAVWHRVSPSATTPAPP